MADVEPEDEGCPIPNEIWFKKAQSKLVPRSHSTGVSGVQVWSSKNIHDNLESVDQPKFIEILLLVS